VWAAAGPSSSPIPKKLTLAPGDHKCHTNQSSSSVCGGEMITVNSLCPQPIPYVFPGYIVGINIVGHIDSWSGE
jgi:hypothetical protein